MSSNSVIFPQSSNILINLSYLSWVSLFLPYFLIVVDGYDTVKKLGIIDAIVEANMDVGFSLIILENKLSKLPSKCSNFITLGANESRILTNSYDSQASKTFKDEINYNINMMNVAKVLSNIPIEINSVTGGLPQTESFLEMERVGKVEQLNILERWRNNDSTESLRAEIGVNAKNELIYLDLHEKAHGPHGLIAGTTGSGKSEFIITYILSMAINYSPDDIAFILIDYKGGGLAYAFENKTTNVVLPHLAGTITNLDKSEMDRTLVSIDSEVKRRQVLFNKAREITEESTIDIYKYQKHFHNGELTEPCPHLFIICDEFAELKSQQPEFMDDLISIARIGRSLGVHLILATQKPSGQVNEQIWTNTKFRVCLKVQSPGDSREMLKKPDAAFIKEAGRFYLQVGQDEIYIQGQSGWAGAKYFPSDTIVKEADKSINIINDNGFFIKSLKSGSSKKAEAQGEQLSAILNSVISIANQSNKHVPKLWLPSLDSVLLLDYLTQKYNITHEKYQVKGIVGEYDAPEIQEQGILEFNCIEKENTLIYGTEEEEKEFFLKTLLYSMYTNHGPDEINTYIIDYGSESLRIFKNFPHVGEIIGQDDADGLKGIIKLIKKELAQRKKEFIQYGGDYQSYIKNSEKKVPIITLIINGYDAFLEIHKLFTDTLLPIVRECARYGIYVYITLSAVTSLSRRASLCFKSAYSLHLKDESAYRATIPGKSRLVPRKDFARGVINNGAVHEFQTASIVEDKSNLSNVITEKGKELMASTTIRAKEIPKLPEKVTFDMIKDYIKDLSSVPIGIEKETLNISKYNFVQEVANFIVGFKIENINSFMKSIIKVFREIKDLNIILVDPRQTLESMKDLTNNYYSTDMEQNIDLLYDFTENNKELTDKKILFIFHGISLLKDQLPKDNKLDKLFKNIKSNKNMTLVVADGVRNLKNIDFDSWYTNLKNPSEGIWVGRGANEQTVIRMNPIPREASLKVDNNYGFHISDQTATFIKLIELYEDKQIVDEENDIPQEESIEEGEVLNEE